MEDWQLREKHEQDFNTAFEKSGCKYFPGAKDVWKYRGKEFWEQFHLLMHTAVCYANCKCQKRFDKRWIVRNHGEQTFFVAAGI